MDSFGVGDSFGKDGNFFDFFGSERELFIDISGEFFFVGEGVGGVEERVGGGNDDMVFVEGFDGGLEEVE